MLNLPNSPSQLISQSPPLRPSLHQYLLLICNENVNETTSAHYVITYSHSCLCRVISNTHPPCTAVFAQGLRLCSWSRRLRPLRNGKYSTKTHHQSFILSCVATCHIPFLFKTHFDIIFPFAVMMPNFIFF
jgi:hypothetical protein